MIILHVTKKYPNALGGDSVVVQNLQKQQQQAGHKVMVLTSNCKEIVGAENIFKFGLLDSPAALDSITIKRIISLLVLPFYVLRIIRKQRPDVIHTHSVDMAFGLSLVARFFKIPLVHTFHIVTSNNPQQAAMRRYTEVWLAKGASPRLVTAPNKHDVLDLQAAGLPARELANGVDLAFWRPEKNVANDEKFMFVSVGRLEPQKGYDYLIKAVAQLASTVAQSFHVVIVGEGNQKFALQDLIERLGVENYITLAGRQSPEQIRKLFSGAQAAVFPSLYETTPLTLLEAWAIGLPVVATPVGILQDDSNADKVVFMSHMRDEKSLCKAMVNCMADDTARQQKAARARKQVKQYSWPDIARSVEMLYGGII